MRTLEDILAKMDPDKRAALINSALKEFGEKRYAKASTNVIVKEAGISKGLLYHYFKSKRDLFDSLRIYAMKLIGNAIVAGVDWENGDPINRLREIAKIKLGIIKQHPYLILFGKVMYEGMSMEEMKRQFDEYVPDVYTKVYTLNIDNSLFKEEIDIIHVMKMIQLFLDGFGEEMLIKMQKEGAEFNILDQIAELEIYLNIFQKAFYKEY